MSRERVYLVNKDDAVIGEKWRDELTDDDCWRVVAIWVTDENGNILLQQRSLDKKIGPGVWSAATEGTIELQDSPEETAVRELEEELGLKIQQEDLTASTKVHYKDPAFGWRIKYGYLLTIAHSRTSEIVLQEDEVSQIKWLSPSELREFIKNNTEKYVLDKEYKALKFY